jgi:hypothetical protein
MSRKRIAFTITVLMVFVLVGTSIWFFVAGKATQLPGVAGVASALVALAALFWGQLVPRVNRTLDDDVALQRIADAVLGRWKDELAHRFVATDSDLVAVRWSPRPDLAGRHSDRDLQISGTMRNVSAIVDQFMRLTPLRRMVLLGAPGSGKSTLAASMVVKILEHAEHSKRVVPVPLSLSSWNPLAVSLADWTSQRIAADSYDQVRKDVDRDEWGRIVGELVRRGRLLPVLDGLDELAEDVRVHALRFIQHGLSGRDMILACRSEEYRQVLAAGGSLTGVAVAEAQDVELDRAIGYLREMTKTSFSEKWIEVYSALMGSGSPGSHALRTPLMLSLIHRAEQNRLAGMPALLLDDRETVDSLTGKLYRSLLDGVDRRYAAGSSPSGMRWSPEKVERWLVNLAQHLDRSELYDIALWQLPQAITRPARMAVAASASVVGLIAGIMLGDLLLGLGAGIATGLVAGFVGGRLAPGQEVRAPVAMGEEGSVLQPQGLFHSLAFGGFGGVASGLVVWVSGVTAWKVLLAAPVAIGLALYVGWQPWHRWKKVDEANGYLTPQQILRTDRFRTLLLAAGVLVCGGILVHLTSFFTAGLVVGLVLGVLASLVVHLFAMAWFSFCISRLFLAAHRTFPLRLVGFLDYMYDCQVLRRAGGVYQFQHATFQDYLARSHHVPKP